MRKIILLLAACLINITGFAATGGAVNASINWTLDDKGTLTISGIGAMPDYDWKNNPPWYGSRNSITTVIVEDGITTIGDESFKYSAIDSIYIGKDVESIGYYALAGLKLSSLAIPDNVKYIGEAAFMESNDLTTVVIGNGVIDIESGAFFCMRLTTLTIGSNVKNIVNGAFGGCRMLTNIYIHALVPPSAEFAFEYYYLENCILYVPAGTKALYEQTDGWKEFQIIEQLPDNIIDSGDVNENIVWTLDDEGALTISGIGNMPNYASNSRPPWYKHQANINSVIIGSEITSIGSYAFNNIKITQIVIPASVTKIGGLAFASTALTTIILEGINAPTIESSAFQSVDRNKCNLIIPRNSVGYTESEWAYFLNVFYDDETRLETLIPISNSNLFWTLKNDTLIISGTGNMPYYSSFISNSLPPWNSIKENILHIKILNGVTSIGDYAFHSCNNLFSVSIPNTMINIEKGAFGNCRSLTSFYIPASLQTMGNYAFNYCPNLSEIIVDETSPYFTSIESVIYNKDKTTLIYYPEKSKNVIIPEGVKNLADCSILGESITSVSIPASVETIGHNIFPYLRSLNTIWVHWDTPLIPDYKYLFEGMKVQDIKLIVPQGTKQSYKETYLWQDFNIIEQINTEITPDALISWQSTKDATNYQLIILSNESHTDTLRIINFDADGNFVSEKELRSGTVDGYQITGLPTNTTYYFSLTAFKDKEIIALQTGSFTTDDNMTTTLSDIREKSTINVYSAHKTIFVENAQGENITVYNTQGQLIANAKSVNGTFKTVVQQAGVYIVRVGGEVWKIAVMN